MQANWSKGIVHWVENGIAYISIVFTWDLLKAYSLAVWYREQGYQVKAGGVAVKLLPTYLRDMAWLDERVDALPRHNAYATFTSRGCIRKCKFCAVPKIEGDLVELDDFVPKPIVCDNNLLACSQRHFDKVVDRLKPLKQIDFNQGLDARLLSSHHIERLQELDMEVVRFAWDNVKSEKIILPSIKSILKAGFPKSKVRCYVLFNFHDKNRGDDPDDALYRCNTLKKMGVLPNVQRYQPLDTLKKNSFCPPQWDPKELLRFCRYWNRQNWLKKVPYREFMYGTQTSHRYR